MTNITLGVLVLLILLIPATTRAEAADVTAADVAEDDEQITLRTPDLEAVIRKKGYVSGVAAGTFRQSS
ncbi:MAG TPA: hypothetical protein VND64_34875 [Pirellulales bacterium]|nr:hypothetical protein [Pirellulales bacterium]